ncbi:MAG: RNA ligase family protein [Gammaproteobacteria bacterium]|nr:RNA ligase family protein [Gammaproteobacteria bacterium]MDE0224110.1 RNA ligase family protein [Gammaproteobacteria bacterium]
MTRQKGECPATVLVNRRFPRIPYWPYSPSIGRDDGVHGDPYRFVSTPVVVTEKLDGGNTLLHAGEAYGRSVSAPSNAKWMAMVKKHHAWKVNEPDIYLYGEDIYGVHSITYDPVREQETFHAFALRYGTGTFASFAEVEAYAREQEIPVVPVLFKGCFESVAAIRRFIDHAHSQPSVLGGMREGVVLRLAGEIPAVEFQNSVCKSVRSGHVQTDEHWTANWKPCKITSSD